MRGYLKLLVPFVLLCSTVHANEEVDSLFSRIEETHDSARFAIYLELYNLLSDSNIDSAYLVVNRALQYAEKRNNQKQISVQKSKKAHLLEREGKIEEAQKEFQTAYEIAMEIGELYLATQSLMNAGVLYSDMGQYDIAAEYLFNTLKISEENEFHGIKASCLTNIGLVFANQEQWEMAIEYYQKSVAAHEQVNDKEGIALLHNNIGIIYYYMGLLDSVLVSFERSLKMYEELGDREGQTRPLFNIGEIYSIQENYDKALEYYNRSMAIEKELGMNRGYATSLVYIGEVYASLKEYEKALSYQIEGVRIMRYFNLITDLSAALHSLSNTYSEIERYDSAFVLFKESSVIKDSLNTIEKSKLAAELEAQYENEKKEQQIAYQNSRLKFRSRQITSLMLILVLLLILGSYILYTNKKSKEANTLLSVKNKLLAQRNTQITHSLTYAQFIQNTLFPNKQSFEEVFPESFIFFKPKDIVSGDFYWVYKTHDLSIIAVADCTGHGVPGAFMSMIGVTFLKEIIEVYHITQPDMILSTLREKVINSMHQKESQTSSRDGMEMAVCVINNYTRKLEYSGSFMPVILFSGEDMKTFKPNRIPISFHKQKKGSFTKQSVSYKKGDRLYLYSDGFSDQFGGPENKKYSRRRFTNLLKSIQELSMQEQLLSLGEELKTWQGKGEQIDDICVIGIRL
jgi:serine phosphatase RsbU (regulator of sigma subunit)/Tfp pilus assembly protein PilF